MGMTMKRSEKAGHQGILANVGRAGTVAATISSPREIAERGRVSMTPEIYKELRMGRRVNPNDGIREDWASERRGRRQMKRK